MGRVRRYKKFKSCDPYAKRQAKGDDASFDEPPDIFEAKERSEQRKLEKAWESEKRREIMLERDAMRMLKMQNEQAAKQEKSVIEGKKETESMYQFKTRIRQETRKTLKEELQGQTSTAKKRKRRLQERKLKRKGIKTTSSASSQYGEDNEWVEEVEDFDATKAITGSKSTAAPTVRIKKGRHSAGEDQPPPERVYIKRKRDDDDEEEFPRKDNIRFGEIADRPPDLSNFAASIDAKHKKQIMKREREEAANPNISAADENPRKSKLSLSAVSNADDSELVNSMHSTFDPSKLGRISKNVNLHKQSSTSGATDSEMEVLRKRVQAAYATIRQKRIESRAHK